jgi:hypothetical protein
MVSIHPYPLPCSTVRGGHAATHGIYLGSDCSRRSGKDHRGIYRCLPLEPIRQEGEPIQGVLLYSCRDFLSYLYWPIEIGSCRGRTLRLPGGLIESLPPGTSMGRERSPQPILVLLLLLSPSPPLPRHRPT